MRIKRFSSFVLEAPLGFGPRNRGFADLCLTTWPWRLIILFKKQHPWGCCFLLERITGLEPATSTLARLRSTKWAKSAYMVPPVGIEPTTRGFSVPCSTNWATEAFWRPERDSNPWPLAWQASVLTSWTTRPNVKADTQYPLCWWWKQ